MSPLYVLGLCLIGLCLLSLLDYLDEESVGIGSGCSWLRSIPAREGERWNMPKLSAEMVCFKNAQIFEMVGRKDIGVLSNLCSVQVCRHVALLPKCRVRKFPVCRGTARYCSHDEISPTLHLGNGAVEDRHLTHSYYPT